MVPEPGVARCVPQGAKRCSSTSKLIDQARKNLCQPSESFVKLAELLADDRPLLADGATGTNLFAMGLVAGDTPEIWNEIHPDRISNRHQDFSDAGSDI